MTKAERLADEMIRGVFGIPDCEQTPLKDINPHYGILEDQLIPVFKKIDRDDALIEKQAKTIKELKKEFVSVKKNRDMHHADVSVLEERIEDLEKSAKEDKDSIESLVDANNTLLAEKDRNEDKIRELEEGVAKMKTLKVIAFAAAFAGMLTVAYILASAPY